MIRLYSGMHAQPIVKMHPKTHHQASSSSSKGADFSYRSVHVSGVLPHRTQQDLPILIRENTARIMWNSRRSPARTPTSCTRIAIVDAQRQADQDAAVLKAPNMSSAAWRHDCRRMVGFKKLNIEIDHKVRAEPAVQITQVSHHRSTSPIPRTASGAKTLPPAPAPRPPVRNRRRTTA